MGANWKAFQTVKNGRFGYGQVEPTHLSAQRTAQIYASLPAADSYDQLENGQFVKYDYANEECNTTGAGEWMMVWNEVKLYDEREQMRKDYAMVKSAFTPGSDSIRHSGLGAFAGQMTPRVIKTNVGDIMITNTLVKASESNYAVTELEDVFEDGAVKSDVKFLSPNADGFLAPITGELGTSIANGDMVWQIDTTKGFTMPDGQLAVKIQRIN